MPEARWSHLLDIPPYPAAGYARLADRIAALLGTENDVLLVQGEAILALEAVAASLGGPQVQALNIVTSPYGRWFGEWLRRGGAGVTDMAAEPGHPMTLAAVSEALGRNPAINLIALVHAESATGILNPLPGIATLALDRDVLLVVDGVASVGGHEFDVDGLGIDIAVIGPQKALGGPSGVSAISVSGRAWELIERPDALRRSSLSLLDLRENWLALGRGALPGMPSALEFHALEAALDRVDAEGLDTLIGRHARAAAATRAAVRALGLSPWADEDGASNLVTALRLPAGIDMDALLDNAASREAGLSAGVGDGGRGLIRLNHTGQRASLALVLDNIRALALGLDRLGHPAGQRFGDAVAAATRRFSVPRSS
jgi:aspartate aminotransferase-like enzyme